MKYRKLKGYKYELLKKEEVTTPIRGISISTPFICLARTGRLYVYPHYAWDGPSGPTIDTPSFMRGSLIHDALYQLMRENLLDHKYRGIADELLRQICIEDGMPTWRARYVYWGVKYFAGPFVKDVDKRGKVIEI